VFRDEGREKDAVGPAGFAVDTIRDTDGDSAVVDRLTADRDGPTEAIARWLGWSDAAELHREHVEAYGDDTVRLRNRPRAEPRDLGRRRAVLRSQAVQLPFRSHEGRVR
jgi:hypothetical protein